MRKCIEGWRRLLAGAACGRAVSARRILPDIVRLAVFTTCSGGADMITKDQFTAIVMALFVWGLAGGLFGALFAGLHQVLLVVGLTGWQPPVVAAAAAAMTTSAFYSAMPVALAGAMAGVLASIGSLIVFGHDPRLLQIAGAAGIAGLAGGSFFAWMTGGGGRPLARTLAGLIGGVIAGGGVAALVAATGHRAGSFVLAAGVVALVGTLFELSERWLVSRGGALFPAGLSAAVVAGLIATMVGAGVWLLGGAPTLAMDGTSQDLLGQIRRELPPGFLGGLLGGAITGVILESLGFHLEDHA
jgi:hypothetical protein